MNLTINDNDELLDESGQVIGPVFDSVANKVAEIPDVQRAYDARIAALRGDCAKRLADKDAALEATIARMQADAQAAIDSQKQEANQKLLAKGDEVVAAADLRDQWERQAFETQKERDALAAQLAASEARTAVFSVDLGLLSANLKSASEKCGVMSVDAGKPLAQRQEEARQAAIAQKQAELDALRSGA